MLSSLLSILSNERPTEPPEVCPVDDLRVCDVVADAKNWSPVERNANRYDMLRRDRIPMAMNWMDLEWREHPVKLDLPPILRQMVKTHFSLNGELSHGVIA
jgi:hypothetical protein